MIILVDALRVDTAFNSDIMPSLIKLRNNAAWGTMHSQPPSYSEPGWTTLLTGAWPDISDGPAMNLDYANIYPFTQDNIFSAAHRLGLKTAISGYYWFEKMLPQGSTDNSFYTEEEDNLADQQVVNAALPWLMDDQISLLLIHIDQVDYAGHHEGGPRSINWEEAAKRADTLINSIVSQLDLNKATVIIVSDHGQIDSGGHGGQETIVLTEPFLLVGNSITPGQYPDIQMVDIAPTISVLLGLNIPATNQGRPLLNMITLGKDKTSLVNIALSNQQDQLLKIYLDAIGQKEKLLDGQNIVSATQNSILSARNTRLTSERLKRGLIAIILLGMCLFLVIQRQTRKTIVFYLLIGIIYSLIFNVRYALLDQHPYSLSWVPGQKELVIYIAVTTTIAYLMCWLMFNLFMKTFTKKPIEAARQTIFLTISTIFIVAIPLYLSFVINGFLVSWTLPDMLSMYLAFVALLQCMVIAIIGIFLAGLSVPISFVARRFTGVTI
ncbi:MAG: hypothetical protein A2X25_11145 [Chloroflexi bacterium GWB2_49_20]|nr:MAG: hypothetical protein A2X25_11145 [Chloroflexi bacterium GWB2_49_20]OGN78891.1 MAG: hypothetical protein A2X26_00210 [Chloroflexi bacterium GWC2_49_37]OGN86348.1 MAG: hypothetical protein A2X27_05570 [Chloroflexi bacterium GWD2_49_16]